MKTIYKTTRSLFFGVFLLVFAAPWASAQEGWHSIRQDYWHYHFYSVFFLPDGQSGWEVESGGIIAHTTNGGATWSTQSSGMNHNLWSVFFSDATSGWAVGESGVILHTANGGTTWSSQTSGTSHYLRSVFFSDANSGWAVGTGGIVLKYTNNTGITTKEGSQIPQKFTLSQNYPNPFNPGTTIQYQLPGQADVRLEIFNLLGESVRTLTKENLPAGFYTDRWDGKDDQGHSVVSGIYLYSLRAGDFVQVRKMVVVR